MNNDAPSQPSSPAPPASNARRLPWGYLAALAVALLLTLGGLAYVIVELDAQRKRAEALRTELAETMHTLSEERAKRRSAEQAEQQEQRRRLALEAQLEVLLDELGFEDVADEPQRPQEQVAAALDEALERGQPAGAAIAELDERLLRQALLEFEHMLAVEPEEAQARDFLHAALLARYAAEAHERAGELLEQALEADPTLVEAYHQRASLSLQAQQFDNAKRDTRLVLELQPNHWRAWILLARIEAAQGNKAVAAEAFARAHAYAPQEYRDNVRKIERATLGNGNG